MTDRKIAAEFIRTARSIKRRQGIRTYHSYEAMVRSAIRQHPPGCMCPFHGGHR